ncbi:MAG: hypothetical protein ACE5IA_03640 [Dehalococcoidia bacterium]
MQIRKTYQELNPDLLFDELRDFIQQQGATLDESKMQSYSTPLGTEHVSRGTLTFKMGGKECLRAHIIGSAAGETKMILDINEKAFPAEKVSALEDDLSFIFGSYEVKGPKK